MSATFRRLRPLRQGPAFVKSTGYAGPGRWRKRKGIAHIRFADGSQCATPIIVAKDGHARLNGRKLI